MAKKEQAEKPKTPKTGEAEKPEEPKMPKTEEEPKEGKKEQAEKPELDGQEEPVATPSVSNFSIKKIDKDTVAVVNKDGKEVRVYNSKDHKDPMKCAETYVSTH